MEQNPSNVLWNCGWEPWLGWSCLQTRQSVYSSSMGADTLLKPQESPCSQLQCIEMKHSVCSPVHSFWRKSLHSYGQKLNCWRWSLPATSRMSWNFRAPWGFGVHLVQDSRASLHLGCVICRVFGEWNSYMFGNRCIWWMKTGISLGCIVIQRCKQWLEV